MKVYRINRAWILDWHLSLVARRYWLHHSTCSLNLCPWWDPVSHLPHEPLENSLPAMLKVETNLQLSEGWLILRNEQLDAQFWPRFRNTARSFYGLLSWSRQWTPYVWPSVSQNNDVSTPSENWDFVLNVRIIHPITFDVIVQQLSSTFSPWNTFISQEFMGKCKEAEVFSAEHAV